MERGIERVDFRSIPCEEIKVSNVGVLDFSVLNINLCKVVVGSVRRGSVLIREGGLVKDLRTLKEFKTESTDAA